MTFFTNPQNLILLVGVLLLVLPLVANHISLWVSSLLFKNNVQKDFEISTVVRLLELKNTLDKEGSTVAAKTCKDLVYAVIYNEKPSRES
jgi:hypothetical protein